MKENNKASQETVTNQNETNSRRDFLKLGALGSITATCGALFCGCGSQSEGETIVEASGEDTVRLLSPEGQLVEVPRKYLSAVQHKIPAISNEVARRGIPGKKFVMVIDLAKCNNARNCISDSRIPCASSPCLKSGVMMSYQARISMPPLMVTGRRGA